MTTRSETYEKWDNERGIPVGAKLKQYVVTFTPGGETALVEASSAHSAATRADEVRRNYKIDSNGADVRPAEKGDLSKTAKAEYVNT